MLFRRVRVAGFFFAGAALRAVVLAAGFFFTGAALRAVVLAAGFFFTGAALRVVVLAAGFFFTGAALRAVVLAAGFFFTGAALRAVVLAAGFFFTGAALRAVIFVTGFFLAGAILRVLFFTVVFFAGFVVTLFFVNACERAGFSELVCLLLVDVLAVVLPVDFFVTGFLATEGFLFTVFLTVGFLGAGLAVFLRTATAFPADDFFPTALAVVVEERRVTDFLTAFVFM